MLEELQVHNLGGIREAELRLGDGLIVLTGESGTGKSSIVRALEFLAGRRAQSALVRHGSEEGSAWGVFSADRLQGIPEEYQPEEGTLLVRRVLSRNGRGKCYLQGKPAALHQLSQVMNALIGIQSQFAQLELLESEKQRELLDAYGGAAVREVKDSLHGLFVRAVGEERKLRALREKRAEVEQQYERYHEILGRIHSIELHEEIEQKWEERTRRLMRLKERKERIDELAALLDGGLAGEGLLSSVETLCEGLRTLQRVNGESSWHRHTDAALNLFQSLSAALASESTQIHTEGIEQELEEIEHARGLVRHLQRELQTSSVASVVEFANKLRSDLDWFESSLQEITERKDTVQTLRKQTGELALQLRECRERTAEDLAARINSILDELGMEGANFHVELAKSDRIRANGADEVRFSFRVGSGTPVPVEKMASGGELSRLMLAIQLALPNERLPGVLVFDEVEAGLGGKSALLAGYKLKELSQRCQVILVTHEATIAALADQHFTVEKEGGGTILREVADEKRVVEVARMLSGDTSSREALSHAQQLLSLQASS
ncbi:MAG: AAA family ATPase [Synergistales bacterium]|nr:AAA family ATPase [Synergistales bacterium]